MAGAGPALAYNRAEHVRFLIFINVDIHRWIVVDNDPREIVWKWTKQSW